MRTEADFGTVVITGASAGVGRAVASYFGGRGVDVGLIARDQEALDDVADEIRQAGGRAFAVAADVSDADALFDAADKIARELGPIGVWVNDAMVTVFSTAWDITPEEFRRVTEVTYLGFVHGTMAALRHMRPQRRGAIIQIGSALAYRGIPLQSAYCGAKYAIRGFTDSVRAELLEEQSPVTLTMMQLPAVNTPQFDWARTHLHRQPRPVAPVVQPEAIAEAVYRAALRPQREYWIGRSTIELILGNMAAPWIFDRYLGKTVEGQQTALPVSPSRRDNLMQPVHSLHRTRGSFGSEAQRHAVLLSGPAARLAPIIVGGALLLGLGALAHRRVTGFRRD
jgi:short-subunit dehydrogenase